MLEVKDLTSLNDFIQQLSTVKKGVTITQGFPIASIAFAIEELASSLKTRERVHIIIDGLSDDDVNSNLSSLKHYFKEDTQLLITLTNSESNNLDDDGQNTYVAKSKNSLGELLQMALEEDEQITAIFMFNAFGNGLIGEIKHKRLQSYIKNSKARVFVFHNSYENEISSLLGLKRFNIQEKNTIKNRFALPIGKHFAASLISSLDFEHSTKNEGFVEGEPVITKVINNMYFNTRFNAFGLHFMHEEDDQQMPIVFFDYELCYCYTNFTVYNSSTGKLVKVLKHDHDPFPLLTRIIKSQVFAKQTNLPYITLSQKETAAKLRTHFTKLMKSRLDYTLCAKQHLNEHGIIPNDERISIINSVLNIEHNLRDCSIDDIKAFKMLHHNIKDFASASFMDKKLFTARDHRGNYLVFELATNDKYNELLLDFTYHCESLGLKLTLIDDQGYSLLDHATVNSAFKNIKTLLDRGISVNLANPLGFTALHRAYACGDTKAIEYLVEMGAKKSKNEYGNYPEDLSDHQDTE